MVDACLDETNDVVQPIRSRCSEDVGKHGWLVCENLKRVVTKGETTSRDMGLLREGR